MMKATASHSTAAGFSTQASVHENKTLAPACFRKAWVAAAVTTLLASAAYAQTSAAAASTQGDESTTVSVTGSRVATRVLADSSTPVDMVRRDELINTGQIQLQNALSITVPSFSVSKPSTAGALDFTSSPTLRGLGPGDLLLMVNGKRRHSTAALNLNNQIGRGDVGYDFNALPPLAIGRVEVLRDGASAIYGADAVAGVINVILDKSMDRIATFSTGVTSKGDGFSADASTGFGIRIGDGGVLRTTVRLQERERSNRAELDTRQQYFGRNPTTGALTMPSGNFGSGTGLTPSSGTLDPREANFDRNTHWLGDSPFTSGALFVNGEIPLKSGNTLYTFGGYSKLFGESQGFFRRPGDDRTVRALHPNGFRPYQNSDFENMSMALGVRGDGWAGFAWDVSTNFGRNSLDDTIKNSNNASLGAASPTSAYVGGFRFSQWTSNLDLSRELSIGGATPARLALGMEYRREQFNAIAGEPDSYRVGGAAILDGPNAGRPAPVGMQMLPGLTPDDAIKASRSSVAAYAELEQDITKNWVVTGAARFERFSDFGDSSTFKLSSRLKVADGLSLRGAVSSGFKAPHLAQSYTSTTTINFNNFVPSTVRLLPVSHPVARLLGAVDLKAAESTNATIGTVITRGSFSTSIDAYRITLKDRLALSTQFASAALTSRLAGLGFPGIDAVQFMTNAIDTTTTGVDIASSWRWNLQAQGIVTATAAANFNKTKIDRISGTPKPLADIGITAPLFDITQQIRVTDSSPRDKLSLALNWKRGDLGTNLNFVRYGRVSTVANTSLTPARISALTPGFDVTLLPTTPASANSVVVQNFGPKVITDLSFSHPIKSINVTVGINNLFDVYPAKNLASTAASVAAGTNGSDNAGIFPYPFISPFGYTGRAYFVKADYRF